MVILVDLDGVCADLLSVWLSLYNKEYGDDVQPHHITEWDTHKFVKEECGLKLYDYLATPNLFRDLPIISGCQKSLSNLVELGHRVIIATAAPTFVETSHFDKYAWVKKHLPFLGGKKNFVALDDKNLLKGDLLIDDGPHNIKSFSGLTCAFDTSYNKDVEATWRVSGWEEFDQKVLPKLG